VEHVAGIGDYQIALATFRAACQRWPGTPITLLIVTASASALVHRELIVALAARHKLPAVYSLRDSVTTGGLISYGADFIEQFRRAAGYVDRILKGAKPADLPVQAPPPKPRGGPRALAGERSEAIRLAVRDHHTRSLCKKSPAQREQWCCWIGRSRIISGSAEIAAIPALSAIDQRPQASLLASWH
jgi:hypothetical protein